MMLIFLKISLLSVVCSWLLMGCGTDLSNALGGSGSNSSSSVSNVIAKTAWDCERIFDINIANISDQHYAQQTHLTHMNITDAWELQLQNDKCFGNGVKVAVVDQAIEITHPDLAVNLDLANSSNYNNPTGSHGTAVGGIIAADVNGIGVVGIAPKSQLNSYGYLENQTDELLAISLGANVDISNNSWGPSDVYPILISSPSLWKSSIDEGTATGRDGKGVIYVWASGNGGEPCSRFVSTHCNNNSNYDGYSNYRKVIAVGGINKEKGKATFSEEGANILITAPGVGIVTTDLSSGYQRNFDGTSASAPMVSGAIALLLEAKPSLGWRDVRKIIARTAEKNDENDTDWSQNGASLWVNHKYGYGLIDIKKAIELAANWSNLSTETEFHTSQVYTTDNTIEHAQSTAVFTLDVPSDTTSITKLETVEIKLSITHPYWADLTIELISPQGTKSVLTQTHNCYDRCGADKGQTLNDWVFSSVRMIDEKPQGRWTLRISDGYSDDNGTLTKINLSFYGT